MGFYVTVEPGVKLFIEDLNPGGSRTIVFLHGWPLSHKQFEYQFDVLPSMGFRCVGIDWRGFGNSDKPIGGYNLERLADDVRMVAEALKLNDFTLAGHSTGGAIAVKYVSRYKGFGVSRLILIDAAVPTGFTKETASHFMQLCLNDRPRMMQEVTDQFFFRYVTKPFAGWFNAIGLEAAGWSTAAIIRMLGEFDLNDDLPAIAVPTLIVHGIHDKVIPFAQAEEMRRKIKNAQLVPFSYSGHGSFYDERDKFNQLVNQFAGG
ncbi:MAG: alpha/beta hydrolase [Cohnella sp.]|nr:alpha/beta hydrolase [Cohnella sp.]